MSREINSNIMFNNIVLKKLAKFRFIKKDIYCIFLISSLIFLNSCSSIVFEISKVDNPIVINSNPFLGDSINRPLLAPVISQISSFEADLSYDNKRVEVYELKLNGKRNKVEKNIDNVINNDSNIVITNLNLKGTHLLTLWGYVDSQQIRSKGIIQTKMINIKK